MSTLSKVGRQALENKSSAFGFLIATIVTCIRETQSQRKNAPLDLPKLKVFTALYWKLFPLLASRTFESENDLAGSLCFFVENWFGLAAEAGLLAIISTFALRKCRSFAGLVLSDLVELVFEALVASTVGFACFWDVDHD